MRSNALFYSSDTPYGVLSKKGDFGARTGSRPPSCTGRRHPWIFMRARAFRVWRRNAVIVSSCAHGFDQPRTHVEPIDIRPVLESIRRTALAISTNARAAKRSWRRYPRPSTCPTARHTAATRTPSSVQRGTPYASGGWRRSRSPLRRSGDHACVWCWRCRKAPHPPCPCSHGGFLTMPPNRSTEHILPHPHTHQRITALTALAYLLLTYFSRRICGGGRPAAFSSSAQASTMSGLPHR